MVDSSTAVFSEPDDLGSALRDTGYSVMLATERGPFRARIVRLGLDHFWLTMAVERRSRVAFVSLPPGLVRILLPSTQGSLMLSGQRAEPGELITYGVGASFHERLEGPCVWRDIVVPAESLLSYGHALTRAKIVLPPQLRLWRPSAEAFRGLSHLHAAATRLAEVHGGLTAGADAARGLERQLVSALVECLATGPIEKHIATADRHAEVMAQFERLIGAHPERSLPPVDMSASLKVSERTLRKCGEEYLGMSPSRYLRLRRMHLVRRALRSAGPTATQISQVASRYGFADAGRFAVSYRALFGESPSATRQRSTGRLTTTIRSAAR